MEMRDNILAIAQRLAQQRGFNGFSYADIANEVGIRKASLHHYFPTKTDLGLALVETYSAQFDNELLRIDSSALQGGEKLAEYVALYRGTLEADRVCLCGMFASEALTLDTAMLPRLERFFVRNTEWLTEVLAAGKSQGLLEFSGAAADHARMFLSVLQGALLIARATGDQAGFDRTTSLLITGLLRKG